MLTFEDQGHVYRWDGTRVPGVTEVLHLIPQYQGVPLALLEAARDFGHNVHLACHLYDINVLDEEALDPALKPYLCGWKLFLKESGFQVVESEKPGYHELLGFAGTPDKFGSMRRLNWLIDIKSGVVPSTVGMQTAAYQTLIRGQRCHRRGCVQLLPNAYRFHELSRPGDYSRFLSCLNFWKILNERSPQHADDDSGRSFAAA